MMAVAERFRLPVLKVVEEPAPISREEFGSFIADYPDLRTELTREGELIIMAPTKVKTGNRNSKLNLRLALWAEQTDSGETFDSSTLFTMPDGAMRSPDASWIAKVRWDALTEEEQEDFTRICPDFVAQLRSQTDRLSPLQKKMREFMNNGAKLGWLIDLISKRVEVYRPGQEVEMLDNPTSVTGDPVLPGFTLNLKGILE